MKLTYFLCSLLLLLAACHKDPPVIDAERKYDERYGPYQRNVMDVYLPTLRNGQNGTVMLIHGGAWVAGDKNNWATDIVATLVNKGYAVASINYRYADGDIHHQMADIQKAIQHIDSNATNWHIAKGKYTLMGASAGGHLALLFAHGFDSLKVVKAAISLVGPTNLADTLFQQYLANYSAYTVLQQLVGAYIALQPQAYAFASPLNYHAHVPTLFFCGRNDDIVPYTQSIQHYDSLIKYNIPSDTTVFYNAGHDVFGPNGVNKNQIFTEMLHWLNTYMP